ncbi:MAG: 50S ribosomal protein L4 [Fimbriimonadales bacterium]
MDSLKILDKSGKAKGDLKLSGALASAEVHGAVLHRTVVAEEANNRQGTQKAKTRAEVRGGGRKPYRQKKTGRARQGTISAPHYYHGGVAFAPVPRDYSKKVNKKERRLAISNALAARINGGDVIVVDEISFGTPRTKEACALLKNTGASGVKRVLVILDQYDNDVWLAFRNIPNVKVRTAPSKSSDEDHAVGFSTRDLLVAHKIIIAQGAFKAMEEAWA